MDIFNVLELIGGLCLFLFGMTLMGQGLEHRAGSGLKVLLGRLTNNKFAGLLTGLGVTAVIQSSSATTVMVVGFVNSGLMTLRQSITVIMGANIGTTVTAWILSLAGISSDNVLISLLKPSPRVSWVSVINRNAFGSSSLRILLRRGISRPVATQRIICRFSPEYAPVASSSVTPRSSSWA